MKTISMLLTALLLSSPLLAHDSSELKGCLESVTAGNESYCYRMNAIRERLRDCNTSDLDWCAEVKHRRQIALEEKKIEVLARLKDIGAGSMSLNSEITSENTNRNRNSNVLASNQRVGDDNV